MAIRFVLTNKFDYICKVKIFFNHDYCISMNFKYLLLPLLCLSTSLLSDAQELKSGYVIYPQSSELASYIRDWEPGKPVFEDEAFFISRVRPKAYFRNSATQIDPSYNDSTDKHLIFWVPLGSGEVNGVQQSVMPNGDWNTEMFSMWSYVTHFGNFSMPYGWVLGSMADTAHKNGTIVSGTASIPWGNITSTWETALKGMLELDKEKVARFLYFHGVDGLAYNSEFKGSADLVAGLRDLNGYLYSYMNEDEGSGPRNEKWENIWYDGTNDRGNITFDRGLSTHNQLNFGDGASPRTSLFFNYNWNIGYLQKSVEFAKGLGRDPLCLYAGVNMQGGEPNKNNWTYLKKHPISIGLWGAHTSNMIWSARNAAGSDPYTVQSYYQKMIEQFFTNGNRNPIDVIEIQDSPRISPSDDFFGMSAYMSARSTLSWNLDEEPFITNFNLGNGTFFNWHGKRAGVSEWANIGVQDYLPTWRWWWADTFLGKSVENVPSVPLTAQFKWDEAYLGGSSLAIQGTTSSAQYLHLFKTRFELEPGDILTVRYKLLGGKVKMSLALSVEDDAAVEIQNPALDLLDITNTADEDQWVEKRIKIEDSLARQLGGKQLALVALHIDNADNLDMRIGEFSIIRSNHPTPATPEILSGRLLYSGITGIDAKLFFNMPNDKAPDEPVYNLDVKTSLFRLYAQIEGRDPSFISATTSWAGLLYRIPCLPGDVDKRIRLGVSAVSLDLESESEIAWTEYMEAFPYEWSNEIKLSKNCIKPGETFSVSYVDFNHPVSNFEIQKDGVTLCSGVAGMGSEWEVDGISDIGQYDLVEICDGQSRLFSSFVQITPESIGACPEIYSLTIDGEEMTDNDIDTGSSAVLGYTGRNADGESSRAIGINEKFIGIPVGDLDIEPLHDFSLAAWVKFDYSGGAGSRFISIENRLDSWPISNWGWQWSDFDVEGKVNSFSFRTSRSGGSPEIKYLFDNLRIVPGVWTHIALTYEYNHDGGFKNRIYINGVECPTSFVEYGSGDNNRHEGAQDFYPNSFPIDPDMWICLGGGAGSTPVYNNGLIDDVAVWSRALTEEDVKSCMAGLDISQEYDDLLGYWTFENDFVPAGDGEGNYFYPVIGRNSMARCGNFAILPTGPEGQGQQSFLVPLMDAGSPFIPGSAFKVVTQPTWSVRGATLSEAEGDGESGSVRADFRKDGDYLAVITLANSLGSDSREYPLIKVKLDPNSIESVTENRGIAAYDADGGIVIRFDTPGRFDISVIDMSGRLINRRNVNAEVGQMEMIGLSSNSVYLIRIELGSKCVKTFKVLSK